MAWNIIKSFIYSFIIFSTRKKKIHSNLFILYTDTGKGIPQAYIKRIYEPFFTTKRGTGGSGLGMNIVYNLVTQKLGGTIQVKSERNSGVKFIIQVPL